MVSGTSSDGSSFMALTTLSPSKLEAHRLRDMSEVSNNDDESSDVFVEDSNPGRAFKCLS
jgi:hypothetical protein